MMTDDIEKRIKQDFMMDNEEIRNKFEKYILEFKKLETNEDVYHMVRCILVLAKGRKGKLQKMIDESFIDYRDVIYWAEYDPEGNKIADFSKPFD